MSGSTKEISLTLSEYLDKMPGTQFKRLYQQPSTVLAMFRSQLPTLAKSIVMMMLYMPTPLALADLDARIRPEAKRQKDIALNTMRTLHVITGTNSRDNQSITLSTNFRKSLQHALEGTGDHNSFGVLSQLPVPQDIDIPFLEKYSRKKWDDILQYVVRSVDTGESSRYSGETGNGPRSSVKELLTYGRLVERKNTGGSSMQITQAGFTFLLQENKSQVWTLLMLWLSAAEQAKSKGETDMDNVDMLSFLFLLSTLQLGRAYSTEALTESRRNMLPYLVDFGVIYVPPRETRQYFPTRLATTLTSTLTGTGIRSFSAGLKAASEKASVDSQDKNEIILETNFRVYAYTKSPLQIAVLALFCDLKMRMPELVSGKLTRSSIRRAVDMGINSDQIISYLATHAHEKMYQQAAATKKPLLPGVIVDQIRLWQLDTERISSISGFWMVDIESPKEYMQMVTFAEEIGILKWRNDQKLEFFVTSVAPIQSFKKSLKKAEA